MDRINSISVDASGGFQSFNPHSVPTSTGPIDPEAFERLQAVNESNKKRRGGDEIITQANPSNDHYPSRFRKLKNITGKI